MLPRTILSRLAAGRAQRRWWARSGATRGSRAADAIHRSQDPGRPDRRSGRPFLYSSGIVSSAIHTYPRPRALARATTSRAAYAVALVVFSVVFVANAWVGDDAFISFRVSENVAHGYGPRWNVAERVQEIGRASGRD